MKNISQALLLTAVIILSGCATIHKDIAHVSLGYVKNPSRLTESTGWRATGLGLEVASRHVTGSLVPSEVGIGIMSAKLLTSGNFQDLAQKSNHFEAWMPVSEAVDETKAKLKMSALMENAIRKAFLPHYQTKIFEYENVSVLGLRDRHRDILVEGPGCENWSCIAIAPIPTEIALQWKGKMVKIDVTGIPGGNEHYVYKGLQNLVFAKITKKYEEDGAFAGHWLRFKSEVLPGFDYEQFFQRISGNLPDWVFYYIQPKNKENPLKGPALLNKGVKTFISS